MSKHSHEFVEHYDGLIGFGLDRETDENTVVCYLQKFSDDGLMALLRKRLTDGELNEIFSLVSRLLQSHLAEEEYHRYFIKE
jgi:hypothetical protein